MNRVGMLILFSALALSQAAVGRCETGQVLGDKRWSQREFLVVEELDGFVPERRAALSKYGGLMGGTKAEATGFFRTQKIDGRWWLIDPEGNPFITVGLCSVNQGTFDPRVFAKRFGTMDRWVQETGPLLKSHGFNTLGCWSAAEAFRSTRHRMPYMPRWNFMSTYKNRRDPKNGARGYPDECMPVFDPEFETFCDEHARQLAQTKDDPWLVGHFSDNELPFRPDSLTNFLGLPKSDTGYKAAKKWFSDRCKGDPQRQITQRDQADFLELTTLRYYRIVGAAIRRYDPNHLYLGSRIHGRTICEPVFRGSKPLDVVSVNYYHRWTPEDERLADWVRWSGKPFLASEWYAMSLDSETNPVSGAGFRVKTDRDRGLFYQNYALGLLKHPGCVGWQWFKYGGDGPGYHKGIVDREYKPHVDLLGPMRQLNTQVYPLRTWFRDSPAP